MRRTTRRPKAKVARPPGPPKRKQNGMRKALLGAFVLGAILGALQTDGPWRGKGILANTGLVIGCGLVVATLMAVVWSLTAFRQAVAALISRMRT